MTDHLRDLIQELVEALEYEGHMAQDGTWEGNLIKKARVYLNHPDSEPPTLFKVLSKG